MPGAVFTGSNAAHGPRGHYGAPWSGVQKVISLLVLGLMGAVGAATVPVMPNPGTRWLTAAVLASVLVGGLVSIVRGYDVAAGEIRVRRLFGATRLPLAGLKSVEADAGATHGSLRLLGNGGFLSTTGWFWNRRLGRYRMFANDVSRAVVLDYGERRVVVAPDDPIRFIREVRERAASTPRSATSASE